MEVQLKLDKAFLRTGKLEKLQNRRSNRIGHNKPDSFGVVGQTPVKDVNIPVQTGIKRGKSDMEGLSFFHPP